MHSICKFALAIPRHVCQWYMVPAKDNLAFPISGTFTLVGVCSGQDYLICKQFSPFKHDSITGTKFAEGQLKLVLLQDFC